MDKIKSIGGVQLKGRIRISGSKNSGLAVMAGSILCEEPVILQDLPDIKDVHSMCQLLMDIGTQIKFDATQLEKYGTEHPLVVIDNANINKQVAEYDFVKKMRASVFVLGPLLGRFGKAKVSLPGGCAIGVRAVDQHIKGIEALGADVKIENGYIIATAPKDGLKGCDFTFTHNSVGATENVISACVLANGKSVLRNCAKEPEVVALCEFLNSLGAKIEGYGTDEITIEGVKKLQGGFFKVPEDRIEAGTYAIASAITDGDVLLTNCSLKTFEGCLDVFENIGIGLEPSNIDINGKNVSCVRCFKSKEFQPYNIETAIFPGFPTDLQAQIMIPLIMAKGKSVVSENIFENRFMHCAELVRMGADIEINGNKAIINGNRTDYNLTGADVMATDLRASASLVLASLVANGETIIDRVYHLDRGYEKLELKLNNCGAKLERICE